MFGSEKETQQMYQSMNILLKWYHGALAAMEREEGQGMVEYALIIALIAILLIVALGWVQGGVETTFDTIGTALGGV